MSSIRDLLSKVNPKGALPLRSSSLKESVLGFAHAVSWSERNVLILLAAELILLVLVIGTRRTIEIQAALLVGIAAVVLSAEHINTYFAENFRSLGWSQNYFTPDGMFMLVMVTGPLLLIALVQLILMLTQASSLLVKAKRAELLRARGGRPTGKDGSPTAYDDLPKKTM